MSNTNTARSAFEKIAGQIQNYFLTMESAPQGSEIRESKEWEDLYYSHPTCKVTNESKFIKNLNKFLPKVSEKDQAELVSLRDQLLEAATKAQAEADAEKADKAARAAERAEKAANKTQHGAPLRKVSKGDFKALSDVLSSQRALYINGAIEQSLKNAEWFKANFSDIPREKISEHHLAFLILQSDQGTFRRGTLSLKPDADAIIAAEATRTAEFEFDAYLVKLAEKIQKTVVSATIHGDIWSGSRLKVTTTNGEVQVWKTQVIWNTSPLGKPFLQWPTTRG